MAKLGVFAVRTGGQDVPDLYIGIGDDHTADEQHELATLLKAGLRQTALQMLYAAVVEELL
jgi:hypothetical protein